MNDTVMPEMNDERKKPRNDVTANRKWRDTNNGCI